MGAHRAPPCLYQADNLRGRLLLHFLLHAGANAKAVQRTAQNLHAICYNRPMRLQDYAPRPAHIRWLLDSDPAIRWQVMRDLTGEALNVIAAERSRVATEGWGAQLLARQSPAGTWGGSPRGWRADLPEEHRDLLITLYSLSVLMDLGLDPGSKHDWVRAALGDPAGTNP